MSALLELKGISKHFPGVIALNKVGLEVNQGEVVALIGENGAGKTTLMKILGGVYQADEGSIVIDGRPVRIRTVNDAIQLGIGFIHQELNVLDNLDVAANVFLGREPGAFGLISRRRIYRDADEVLRRLGLELSSREPLSNLSLAQQQLVEIAKALSLDARILIMDEPTSSLTVSETERLLSVVRELRDQGVSIIYITHRLGEVSECADRVVVLRDGENAGMLGRDEIEHERMVHLMVGRNIEDFYVHSGQETRPGFFKVENLRTARYPGRSISFEIAGGEILGFAGLVGAGRSEVARAVFGVDASLTGTFILEGRAVPVHSARSAIARGIYLVPEDRRSAGLITDMAVHENVTLPSLGRYAVGGLIRGFREREATERQCTRLDVRTPSVETRVASLSGGNQQKVVLAKWLSMEPKLIIFDEPTRGIDVAAKSDIYKLMRDLAARGVAIMMISSDMEEILNVSDRVAVMHEGEITGFLDRKQLSEDAVMSLAVGERVA
jgi:ribose transport system ATP-binding protein